MPSSAAPSDCPAQIGSPCVIVDVQAGSSVVPHAYSLAQVEGLAENVDSGDYVVHTNDHGGTANPPQTTSATTVRSLVAQAVPDLSTVTFSEVLGSDGARHVLKQDELGPDGDNGFPGGLPPVVYAFNDQQLTYLRTARDDDDLNGAAGFDQGLFVTDPGAALHITAHTTGALLTPTIVAKASDPKHPERVSFSVKDADPGLTYKWDFDDGDHPGISTEAAPVHDFGSGAYGLTYVVKVEVESPTDGSYGQGTDAVSVGPKPTASGNPTGGTTSSSTATPTGPIHTSHTPSPSGPGSGTTSGPGVGEPTVTVPTDPGATTSAPTSTVTDTTGTSASALATGTVTAAVPPPGTVSSAPPSDFLPPEDPIPEGGVQGVLLQAMGVPPVASDGGSTDNPQARTDDPDDRSQRVDPRLWLTLSVIALLSAGAASEGRGFHTWLLKFRRSHRTWAKIEP